jgi:lipopolysaccharide biosynthesis protein
VKPTPQLLAFHLPQYHPIPENDEWWGRGFTEWQNVARAVPLFSGHYQPHLPANLGFYDLRLPEVRHQQANLARQYGISGFCYYHYWFNGKQLLERPFNEILSSGKPDFPFCLCWANESWSRRWIGDDKEILIHQSYSETDDINHANYLALAFGDHRYIKINGRPLFLIFRPGELPDPKQVLKTFRDVSNANGLLDPYFVAVDAHKVGYDFRKDGFDSILAFSPQLAVSQPEAFQDGRTFRKFKRNIFNGIVSSTLKIFDDEKERSKMEQISRQYPYIPSCFVSWDNSARRGRNGIIYANHSPSLFEKYLRRAIAIGIEHPHGHGLTFINAWNEWAEGNHLEPDLKYGLAYLETCKKVLSGFRERIND